MNVGATSPERVPLPTQREGSSALLRQEREISRSVRALESPCQNICHLNVVTGLCDGCGRTGAEIAAWINLAPEQRRAIMTVLPQRMKRAAAAE